MPFMSFMVKPIWLNTTPNSQNAHRIMETALQTDNLYRIGHAEAFHNPDWPALVWKDKRLIKNRVDNKSRFLEAAQHILAWLAKHIDHQMPQDELQKRQTALKNFIL